MWEYLPRQGFFSANKVSNAESWKRPAAAEMGLTDGYEAAGEGDEEEKQQFWPETEHFVGRTGVKLVTHQRSGKREGRYARGRG